ncbi:MAG: nucleotidyltransferase domain-containing protein [Pseudolysinimonas sp.]
MSVDEVTTVSDARAGLTETLKRFRAASGAAPVIFGSHRRPEAAIVPYDTFAAARPTRPLLDELISRAALIERFARLSGVSAVRVFGSVARREEGEDSDIDLLVTPTDATTLFDIAQFASDIELLMGRSVDVVTDRSLDADKDRQILRDAISL